MSDFFNKISNAKYPYIIAEIGSNHNGDVELAKRIIKSAKDCGCDCVKFQSWTPESLIAKEEYERNQKYNDSPKKHFGSLREMVEKYYLRTEQHHELLTFCRELRIDFASSAFSNAEVDLLMDMDVPFIKVASMDVNNLGLLEYLGRKDATIILSTGMASLAEIDTAIKTIEKTGNKKIVVLHCISIYPPDHKDIHLNNLTMLKQTFGYPVGFSDHTLGVSIPLASVALGACVIEKHFTLDKDMPGWDHEISADPAEMQMIVRESRNISEALGSYQRIVSEAEEQKKLKFRRSAVSAGKLPEGHILTNADLKYKRPGTGIAPDEIEYVLGRPLKRDVEADELIKWEDLG